jgi:DAK2 domain fusion protein YloV
VAAATSPHVVTGAGMRRGLARALSRLAEQRDWINDLNVFPVPDGDTGTNMHLTLEAASAEVKSLPGKASVDEVAQAAAHGSLMGARGNSGVILSQVLRGVAAGCRGQERIGPKQLAEALEEGARSAYRAVKRPVEGTILTVARDAAAKASQVVAEDGSSAEVLQAAAAEAWAAVDRSKEQLDVLRQAGVVDAGGFGLAVILSAMAEEMAGTKVLLPDRLLVDGASPAQDGPAPRHEVFDVEVPEGGFGYCTEFILVGSGVDLDEVRGRLVSETEDDSALVVGDKGLIHVHLHTMEPWSVLSRAAAMGQIERLKVEDMTGQHQDARRRTAASKGAVRRLALGVVAVAPGSGFQQLLLGLGAAMVVEGGQAMNPSTEDLLKGIDQAKAAQVLVLPNNPNLVLGAEQAARVSPHEVAVVPSRNLPQGIAALLAFDPEARLEVNRQRMQAVMGEVHAIEVTEAMRDSQFEGGEIARGDVIALLDGDLVASGKDLTKVVLEALGRLEDGSFEVVTLFRGSTSQVSDSEVLADQIRSRFPGVEVECHDGGQALYPYIISAE